MLDVDWGDLIDYLGNDPRTQSIIMYMESVGDARSFLSAAREVSLTKPIIVIKAGRTEAAAQAAASHTGSLTGSDEVLDAAFRRCGVLRVQTIADLFYMAEVLAKQPRPKGPRLAIVTNAGGPGRAGRRRLALERRATGAALSGVDGRAESASAAALEPQQSHRRSRRRSAGTLRQGHRDCGPRSQHRRPARHHLPAGNGRADRHRGAPETLCALDRQAGAGELDGRRRTWRRAPTS